MVRKPGKSFSHLDEFSEGKPGVVISTEAHVDFMERITELKENIESRNGQINALFEVAEWLAVGIGASGAAGPYGVALAGVAKVAIPMLKKITTSIRTGNRVELIDPVEFGAWLDEIRGLLDAAKGKK